MKINSICKEIKIELPDFVWERLEVACKKEGVPIESFIEMIVVMKLDDIIKSGAISS